MLMNPCFFQIVSHAQYDESRDRSFQFSFPMNKSFNSKTKSKKKQKTKTNRCDSHDKHMHGSFDDRKQKKKEKK